MSPQPRRSARSSTNFLPVSLLVLGVGLVVVVAEGSRRESARLRAARSATVGTLETGMLEKGVVAVSKTEPEDLAPVLKTDEQWRRELTPEQYRILREKGTERAFTGAYFDTKTAGTYLCAGCGTRLFRSDAKFDSGCGWPSFFEPLEGARLLLSEDRSHGWTRTEVCCRRCGGHLGHVFDDGPEPTGLRFCINSASIRLAPLGAAPGAGGDDPPR